MKGLAFRRTAAFFVFAALLTSVTVIAAPGAFAHHPEISASSRCDGYEPVIDFEATSWATGAKGSNVNVGIYVNGVWQTSGSFSEANGYRFDGQIPAGAFAGQTVTVMARADAPWGNKNPAGDWRATDVAVTDDCGGTTSTTVEETTTTVQETTTTTHPGTFISGNPKCADLGYLGVKSDPPGTDEVIDGISFDYNGTSSVTVSSVDGQTLVAVIVKGGNGAYIYDGPFVDLVAPINNGGQQAAISHVEACVKPGDTTTTTTVPDQPASVEIYVGKCREVSGVAMTPVRFTIDPAGSSIITVDGPDGQVVVTQSGSLMFGPGDYTWSAIANDGFVLEGAASGSFSTKDCTVRHASVAVELGVCGGDDYLTDLFVEIGPDGGAIVTVEGPGGPYTVDGAGATLELASGQYTWSASAADGYVLVGETSGEFTVEGCTPSCDAQIGDYVWIDLYPKNGLQDEGEDFVAGVTVHLLDADGTVIATTVTDDAGHYLFAGLCEGTYRVRFELPDLPGLVNEAWTSQGGGDAALDSNADSNGETSEIVVVDGTNDLTWDAGIIAERVSPTTVTTMPTTSTTEQPTTTTTEPPTTSSSMAPATSSTTVPTVTASTLPFTGFEMQATALLGLLALAGGAALLVLLRRPEETTADNDSIGAW